MWRDLGDTRAMLYLQLSFEWRFRRGESGIWKGEGGGCTVRSCTLLGGMRLWPTFSASEMDGLGMGGKVVAPGR